ncbi:hypothetical protein AJ78_03172 [Emergomyces pasteurianus Ep9510]|uniref:Uncharacterized protein n=1 Tax=Emergomyces pasteurianus Ep9510 TaxID=1447872 RepID=A0A1J9PKQ6_9EURO|nr:hypothetical protein AJ78_03172 [Emergomyces pasteurianus Ep9510]
MGWTWGMLQDHDGLGGITEDPCVIPWADGDHSYVRVAAERRESGHSFVIIANYDLPVSFPPLTPRGRWTKSWTKNAVGGRVRLIEQTLASMQILNYLKHDHHSAGRLNFLACLMDAGKNGPASDFRPLIELSDSI